MLALCMASKTSRRSLSYNENEDTHFIKTSKLLTQDLTLTETANRKYELAPAKSFANESETNETKYRSTGMSCKSMVLLVVDLRKC